MIRLYGLIFLVLFQVGAASQEPVIWCNPSTCQCLTYHKDWCREDIPPPNCCRTGEYDDEGNKRAHRCGCCLGESGRTAASVGKLCLM